MKDYLIGLRNTMLIAAGFALLFAWIPAPWWLHHVLWLTCK